MKQDSLLTRLRQLEQHSRPGQSVLIDSNASLTCAALVDGVSALANCLREQNIQVLALRADNSIDWVLVDLACQEAELVCLPLPEFFSVEQLEHCLRSTHADLLLGEPAGLRALVNGCALIGQEIDTLPFLALGALRLNWSGSNTDKAYSENSYPTNTSPPGLYPVSTQKITFTSGSTGAPKGVCLSQEHQWQVAESLAELIAINQSRHLCLLPLATLLENIAGVYTPLLCGGTVILPDASSRGLSGSSGLDKQRLIQCVDQYQPNSLILLPQLLSALVVACQAGWQPSASLKFVAVGGGKVAAGLIIQARQYGIPVYEGYGLSECGSVVALNTPANDKPGSVGKLLPHCQVRLKNDEVMVTGAGHLGYLGQIDSWSPKQIATGDLGTIEDGRLSIYGRRKNLLISSFGRNISPEWVESELNARPLLNQCVVVGDARPYLAALLSAPVAVSDAAIGEWIDRVNQKLPDYAQVQVWRRLDQEAWKGLLTANGRPQRELIVERYAELIESCYPELVITQQSQTGLVT
ncbi:MAG: AMP-binding protein [Porticoccaceae bacterium]|nr:AMP-binding protein [Porticoccaceae bacterium]